MAGLSGPSSDARRGEDKAYAKRSIGGGFLWLRGAHPEADRTGEGRASEAYRRPPAEAKPHVEKPLLDHHYEHGDDAALAPYRKVAAECERALESLRKQEITGREDVQRRAKEIQSKQYRPPEQKPIPCLAEQKACTICLTENRSDPLKCQDVVKAYARCAEQVRQRFVTTGFGSPPMNN
ncbi:hypothetical protein KP509_24G061500 [Ceratopteris richardii]|uniref:Uncharacterized protein n=1 Tax=Ceratopteris richardii TaxID=49495 RepID=A0A8T2RVK2_CERRI|nr:hypothetical protein KP509_24G061500 [Ceratopteris richardii]